METSRMNAFTALDRLLSSDNIQKLDILIQTHRQTQETCLKNPESVSMLAMLAH